MNSNETATLVERIVGTWPNGPRGFIWTEALNDHPELDSRLAGQAYRSLRDGALASTERMTIARFIVEYRMHAIRENSDDTAPPDYCALCDGCGWVSVPTWQAHNPRTCHPTDDHPCCCHASEPCMCTKGRGMVDVQRRIVEFNDRHRTGSGVA